LQLLGLIKANAVIAPKTPQIAAIESAQPPKEGDARVAQVRIGHEYSARKVLAHARIATSKNALSEAAPDASAQTIAA
jgi:hypothetical protein